MRRPKYLYGVLAAALLTAVMLNLMLGTVSVSFRQIGSIFMGHGDSQLLNILVNYRLPRMLLCLMVGGCLALAGAILQGLIQNPLASPDVIGLSKGAGLAAVMIILLFPGAPVGIIPWAAFIGASIMGAALMFIATRFELKPTSLALSGMALGAMAGAGIQYVTVKHMNDANTALLWLAGSLWGRSWEHVWLLLPWAIIAVPLLFYLSFRLDVLQLGDNAASGLGLSVRHIRIVLLTAAVCLTGISVAVAGTIGFIGLIAPHMARKLTGPIHKHMLPVTALLGAILVTFSDVIGRIVISPREVPVGIVTAIIGAPYFLYLLGKKK
ncbi:iron complex transport system permease protein [Paenibacillus forsythiae]|uniref:Iron complex transport system permease protein n=1 Tax=Paenibacillus forsythiae TaxID=365616 RepID=A0ABU3HB25_9BACL|nr:iron ABC transporter permease [Paenibacillus forsythiae]MDT3427925.1 iron complex transport system permease protein [Paenibacillus forsythiae]